MEKMNSNKQELDFKLFQKSNASKTPFSTNEINRLIKPKEGLMSKRA